MTLDKLGLLIVELTVFVGGEELSGGMFARLVHVPIPYNPLSMSPNRSLILRMTLLLAT